jgi:perosamine synthetase
MVGILELHGLRPVPVDLDLATLEPRPDLLRATVTARTRMILVAHLFGAIVDLRPAAELARQRGLLLVEDCAQSLADGKARGDSLADVSMFSFGPIKTATALGGATVRVRDAKVRERMRRTLAGWPVQARPEFFRRTAKFSLLQLLANPVLFGLFVRACTPFGRDLDDLLSAFVRGFKCPYDDLAFLARIRRQPCAPLLALLLRRLRRFDSSQLRRRAWIGEELAGSLHATAICPGQRAGRRTHWVFSIIVGDPGPVIARLRSRGFDAAPADAISAITVVSAPPERPELEAIDAAWMLSQAVFLPCYPQLADRALRRLIRGVRASV